ncbi:MAG: phosphatidylglycerol lysyltransferase domain-containing protein [Bradymonadia bacterium]
MTSAIPTTERWHSADPDPERACVLALLQRYGWSATSFQILEPGFQYWFDGDTPEDATGVVAYVDAPGHRVVAGPPVTDPDDLGETTRRFVEATRAEGRRAVFFAVEADFIAVLEGLDPPLAHDALPIAEQPEWAPADYTLQGSKRRTLRAQVNRARNKGVRVRRIEPEEIALAPGPLRAEIESVLSRWLASRRMSVMRFMVDLEPFTFPEARRYYVAEQGDRAVGFLAAIPVYRRKGWFFEDVIRVPEAPNGTAELLIHTAMADAAEHDDLYVTLGMAPLAGVPQDPGPHRMLRRTLGWCYQRLGLLYHFPGVRAFKARFHPDVWVQQYMVACPPKAGARSIHAVLSAFAGGGLVAFGLDTARRLLARLSLAWWSWALYMLGVLLVPWTLVLALADGRRWFGDVSIQWAWVIFDAVMVFALLGLGRLVRRRPGPARLLAVFLAGATWTDFVLTTVQAFHLHRAVSGWSLAFVLAGMSGPLLATLLLLVMALVLPAPVLRHRP